MRASSATRSSHTQKDQRNIKVPPISIKVPLNIKAKMTDFICVPACSSVHYLDSLSQFALAKKRGPVAGEAFVTMD